MPLGALDLGMEMAKDEFANDKQRLPYVSGARSGGATWPCAPWPPGCHLAMLRSCSIPYSWSTRYWLRARRRGALYMSQEAPPMRNRVEQGAL